MKLLAGFQGIGCGVLFEKTLVLSDLHLGFEKSLGAGTGLISRFQFDTLVKEVEKILKVTGPLDRIILNGDIKHEFGSIQEREWRYILRFLDLLQRHAKKIVLIRGNHDTMLQPIAKKRNYPLEKFVVLNDVLVTHGDDISKEVQAAMPKCATIIVGHEHPAISLRKGARVETFKCFLVGKWRRKNLIVVPSANPLSQGTDVITGVRMSPFLPRDLSKFRAVLVGEEGLYDFGAIKNLATVQRA